MFHSSDRKRTGEDCKSAYPYVITKNFFLTAQAKAAVKSNTNMLLNLILLCLRCFSVAAGPSASTFAGATTAFQYPPNVTAVPTSDFPDESEVGFGGPTPSTSRFSYCHSLTNSTFFQLGMKRWLSRRHRPSHQWMISIRLWHLLLSTAMSRNSTYSATSEIFHQ